MLDQSIHTQPDAIPESNLSQDISKPQQSEGFHVNKNGFIEIKGVVEELLPAGTFRVTLENGYVILAHLAGKMRMNKIRLIPGDGVKVEMSPYDVTKGRITYRF